MKTKKISQQERNRRNLQSLNSKGNVRYDLDGSRYDLDGSMIKFHYDKSNNGYRVEHEN